MARLFITEVTHLAFDPHGNGVMSPQMPALGEQFIDFGGASLASAPFGNTTRYVMLNTDASCCLAWGKAPVAVPTAQRLGPNETRFYGVNPGDSVAVIASP